MVKIRSISHASMYGKTSMVAATSRVRPVQETRKTEFLTVMELQEMARNDSSQLMKNSSKKYHYNDIDFDKLVDKIIASKDLKK